MFLITLMSRLLAAGFIILYDTNVSLKGSAGNEGYGERVPKRVDHEERRRQIADALVRTAATRGLHATGMREVAAEAGVSLRLVQYYFGTKEELLLSAMQQLAAQFAERGLTRIRRLKETGGSASPRDIIAAILTEALPVDDERRTFTIVNTAYVALSLTDPALAIAPLARNSTAVIDVVAAQLRAAQAAGDTPAHLDPELEAAGLLAMSAGLGPSVLVGQSSAGQAQAVIDYHLYRLFPASRPALRRAPMKLPVSGRPEYVTASFRRSTLYVGNPCTTHGGASMASTARWSPWISMRRARLRSPAW
jgi:AcrR family transcriptional regulator